MSRFQRRLDSDAGYADGHIFVPITSNLVTGSGAAMATSYNGLSNLSVASLPTAATAYVATLSLNNALLFRYGVQDDLQEYFGSGGINSQFPASPFGAQGLPVANATAVITANAGPSPNANIALLTGNTANFAVGATVQIDTGASAEFQTIVSISAGVSITVTALSKAHTTPFNVVQNPFTTPAGVTGAPPFTGSSNLTSVTAPRPKGILLKSISPVYSIANGVAAPTVNTIGIIATTFLNAQALATQDTILAVAANGLQTAANAASQVYVTPIAIPAGKQVFQTSRFKQFVLTWNVTTGAATGTAALFGVWFDVTYAYN